MRRVTARIPDKIVDHIKARAEEMFGRPNNAVSAFIIYCIVNSERGLAVLKPNQIGAIGADFKQQMTRMFEEELSSEDDA
jgi:hypothetical protein